MKVEMERHQVVTNQTKYLKTKCLKDQSQISSTQDSTNKDQFFYGWNCSRSLFRVSDFNLRGVVAGEGDRLIGTRKKEGGVHYLRQNIRKLN